MSVVWESKPAPWLGLRVLLRKPGLPVIFLEEDGSGAVGMAVPDAEKVIEHLQVAIEKAKETVGRKP